MMSSDDPSKDWDRFCRQEEDIVWWQNVVEVGRILREVSVDFYPVDASYEFIWFINAKKEDCKFSMDVITGDGVCVNYPTLKAPWDKSDGEIDFYTTANAVIEAIRIASGPKAPTPDPVDQILDIPKSHNLDLVRNPLPPEPDILKEKYYRKDYPDDESEFSQEEF